VGAFRVVSSEISGNFRKFIPIFPEISGNLLNNFFHFIIFNYNHIKFENKHVFTNNSPDLCVLTLCIKFRQNNLYLASLPRISANLNDNYRGYTSRL